MANLPVQPDAPAPCPACGAPGLETFYEVRGIPVQSNLLMPTAADARACPTGDLSLALCRACGFVTNTAFDFDTQQHTARYEATQGFSPTFSSFAKSLARQWAERYALRGKRALEIGCGRGEFAALLCDVAGCEAIGIDPVADPAHPPAGAGPGLTLVADYYSERYADLAPDFVCCRHTLEHIPAVGEFVRTVRQAVGNREGVAVCFEVPDTLRVLREGAFWDVYFEHCSYFTTGSLARLFRASGFDLLDLRRAFDDQYVVLESRPAHGPTAAALPLENDLADVIDAVTQFRRNGPANLDRWRRVAGDAAAGRRVALWGSGSKAVGFLTTLGLSADAVPFVVDINPNKHDTYLPGTAQRIVSPEALRDYRPDVVVAMNPVYRQEIAADLVRLDVRAELMAL